MSKKLLATIRSPALATFFTLYCVPAIHAAAIVSANYASDSSSPAPVARSWVETLVGYATNSAPDSQGLAAVSATATDATAYLRIASLSIALYEYVPLWL